jgi:outer membrane usher protein
VPSTVEVFVDNPRTFSREVPAGPYSVTNLPIMSGAGQARVVPRDASGRTVETSLPFFATPQLLREGLWDFAAQAGFPRLSYAVLSNSYSEHPVGIGSVRYGLTDSLTLEAHGEGGAGLFNGGAGVVTNAGAFGVLSLAGRASQHEGRTGFQAYGAFETRLFGLTLNMSSQRSFGDFEDLASVTARLRPLALRDPFDAVSRDPTYRDPTTTGSILRGSRPPRALDRISIGMPLPSLKASLGLSFINLEREQGDRSRSRRRLLFAGLRQEHLLLRQRLRRRGEAQGRRHLRRVLDAARRDGAGLARRRLERERRLRHRRPLEAAGGRARQLRLPAPQCPGQGPGLSRGRGELPLRVRARRGRGRAVRPRRALQRRGGRLDRRDGLGRVLRQPHRRCLRRGAADVPVFHENRPVGRTGARGKILVPNLRSYQRNRIAIDPGKLPVDAHVGRTDEVVVPAMKSGVQLDFGVKAQDNSAVVILQDGQGRPLRAGLRARLEGGEGAVVVGYDGRAFLRRLGASNTVVVELAAGECRASFDYAPRPGEQVVVGPVPCL